MWINWGERSKNTTGNLGGRTTSSYRCSWSELVPGCPSTFSSKTY